MNHKKVIEYTSKYRTVWSDYVERSPRATIAHEIFWKSIIQESLGHKSIYLMVMEKSAVRGILPLFIVRTWWRSRYLVSLPWIDYGGVCADDPETERLLISEARNISDREKVNFMELRSVEANDSELTPRQDKVTFLLELDRDTEKIWKGFSAKLRNLIRKSEKCGVTTEFGGIELLPSFYKVFSHNMRDLGTPVWGINLFESILKNFQGRAEIILVKKNGNAIAGGLVLSFKDRLYVPSASAYRKSLKYAPNYALYWGVIRKGCEQGYQYFDFGRSTWNSNTFNFKKQWVGTPSQLTWQYYLRKSKELPAITPSSSKYRIFIAMWKKLPIPVANYLGSKVIKNFP